MKEKEYLKYLFRYIGDNPDREGLIDTPDRILKSYKELYSGYEINPTDILKCQFVEGACDEMVILKDIEFYSMCEHHQLPFFGEISIGYLPNGKVVGVSKLARLVDVFARRMQIQERLTTQIADTLVEALTPKGVMVICQAQHLCMTSRGVRKQNARMITSAVRGVFLDDVAIRNEFMQLVNWKKDG